MQPSRSPTGQPAWQFLASKDPKWEGKAEVPRPAPHELINGLQFLTFYQPKKPNSPIP